MAEARVSTRERLLDAAFDLFVEVGYQGATITEVERRVGLTPGTGSFYRHFASKQELLLAAVDHEVARCRVEMAEARAGDGGEPGADRADRQQRVASLELILQDIRRFDRLFRLMLAEGDRVPGLRDAISAALAGPGAQLAWAEDPTTVVTIAALAGYHFTSLLQGRPFQDAPESEFLETLAELLPGAPAAKE